MLHFGTVRFNQKQPTFRLEWIIGLLNTEKLFARFAEDSLLKTFSPEAAKRADAERRKMLRYMVNQWIDSGKDNECRDLPKRRNLKKVLYPPPNWDGHLISSLTSQVRLLDTISDWLERHPPEYRLHEDGRIECVTETPELSVLMGKDSVLSPEDQGRDAAIFQFVEFVNTPGSNRLSRCDNPQCQRYYLRVRARNRETKRGTYCGKCESVGAAVRTKLSRTTRKQRLIELAAEVWPHDWKPTRKHKTASEFVAAAISKQLRNEVKHPRWVTSNRSAIEAEIERRKHAKG